MKRRLIISLIFAAAASLLLSRALPKKNVDEQQALSSQTHNEVNVDEKAGIVAGFDFADQTGRLRKKIGYCPTMSVYASQLDAEGYELVLLPSSAVVLEKLSNQEIDLALIGRRAKSFEKNSLWQELMIDPGYTLISAQNQVISESDLKKYTIHTALNEETAKSLLPLETELVLYDTMFESVEYGLSETAGGNLKQAVLIAWEDYREDYNLLVPMQGEQKAIQFRTPILYYLEQYQSSAQDIKLTINTNSN